MLNYRHLYYFWVVTKEGGFAARPSGWTWRSRPSAPRCGNLRGRLGYQLLKPAGRGVAITEAGQAAFARAEEIFQIGQAIPTKSRGSQRQGPRLAVGLSDGISKLAAHARWTCAGHAIVAASVPRRRIRATAGRVGAASLDLVLAGQQAPRTRTCV